MSDAGAVGGYYVDFSQTLAVMQRLNIDRRGERVRKVENPINDWLAKNKILHVTTGSIRHPQSSSDTPEEDGIFFMTRFEDDGKLLPFAERDEDRGVKKWLMNEGGIEEDQIEWLSFLDTFNLTLRGTAPKEDDGEPIVRRIITDQDFQNWNAHGEGLPIYDWLNKDSYEQWKEHGKGLPYLDWMEEKYERDLAEQERARLQRRDSRKRRIDSKRAGNDGPEQ